jgi:hypothetical protein
MIFAHAAFAISGIISGVGFAIAKIIESVFIVFTISQVKTQGAETQIKTSVHFTASDKAQSILDLLVIFDISCFSLFKSVLFCETIHLLSQTIISHTQYRFNNFIIAVQAAHNQLTTTLISSFFFQVIFIELINPARQTIAVQC